MPKFGKEEIRNLTKVIESGVFCDKRGGFMDGFRTEFARALHAKHALTGGSAMLLMHAIPGAIGAGAGDGLGGCPAGQLPDGPQVGGETDHQAHQGHMGDSPVGISGGGR